MNTALLIIFSIILLAGLCQLVFSLRRWFSPIERSRRFCERVYKALSMREIAASGVIPEDIVDFLLELGKTVSKPTCNPRLSCLYVNVFLMKGKPWYDPGRVFEFLERKAREGDPECQLLLGRLLKEGFAGNDADPVMGAFWMREAAKNGVPVYSPRARDNVINS